ncbi:MAG: ABC transporter ATP-binding protein [bacterium]
MHTQNKLKLHTKNIYSKIALTIIISMIYALINGIGLSYVLAQLIDKNVDFIYIFIGFSIALVILGIITENIRLDLKIYYKSHLEDEIIKHLSLLKNPLFIDTGRSVAFTRKLTDILADNLANLIVTLPLIAFSIVFSCIYALTISPIVLFISIGFVIIIMLFNKSMLKKLPELQKDLNDSVGSLMAVQWELIKNREIGRFLNGDNVVLGFNNMTKNSAEKLIKSNKHELLPTLFLNYGNICVIIIVAVVGGVLSINNTLSLSELFGLIILIPTISQSLFNIPKQVSTYIVFKGHLNTMDTIFNMDIIDVKQEEEKIKFDKILENNDLNLKINLKDFKINDNKILENINLNFESNKLYVLKGESGCGKTTLLNIIAKLINDDFTKESITINNTLLDNINVKDYWENITYLSQNPVLLDGDINFNISLDKSDNYNKALVEDAINFANIKDLLNINSSGEVQKVGIARAFYKQPKIWLLDECTASLDKESEKVIVKNLKDYINNNIKNNTKSIIIFISHNEYVQNQADELIILG